MQPSFSLRDNLAALSRNPYPGRGIVMGLLGDGVFVQIYWIMGRSENSRNRIFEKKYGMVYTTPADPTKVKDPSLTIYNALRDGDGKFVVSNGAQTDDVMKTLLAGGSLSSALLPWAYEPDEPNYTPRITGVCSLAGPYLFELSILRKSLLSRATDHHLYQYESVPKGVGYCVTTYDGDGNPLPSFAGVPYPVPLEGGPVQVSRTFWDALNKENRVSLAVKAFSLDTGRSVTHIINKYEKV